VRAELAADSGSITLTLPSGEEWRFAAERGAIGFEESIFFAAPGGAMLTNQIVLHGTLSESETLNWSFLRLRPVQGGASSPPRG
jgi:uncharacterized heparinase superfamily protein